MENVAEEHAALQAIIKIIRNQKKLERSQRDRKASLTTLQDSMVYAYDEIIQVVTPFMNEQV